MVSQMVFYKVCIGYKGGIIYSMRSSIGNSIAVFFRAFCNVLTGGSIEGLQVVV